MLGAFVARRFTMGSPGLTSPPQSSRHRGSGGRRHDPLSQARRRAIKPEPLPGPCGRRPYALKTGTSAAGLDQTAATIRRAPKRKIIKSARQPWGTRLVKARKRRRRPNDGAAPYRLIASRQTVPTRDGPPIGPTVPVRPPATAAISWALSSRISIASVSACSVVFERF
jgi:hypothetical protein